MRGVHSKGSDAARIDGANPLKICYEHGFPAAHTTGIVEAVALETALYGARRRGHLHRAEHGDPVPARRLEAVTPV